MIVLFTQLFYFIFFLVGYNQINTGQADCDPCPKGYYCPSKTSTPLKCPPRHYCPAATTVPLTCPNGTFTHDNMSGLASADQCLPCITGSYCRLGEVVGPCDGGYYCKSRSPDPNPTGVWKAMDSSIVITPCPNNITGNYSGGDNCSSCRTGKFCLHRKYFNFLHLSSFGVSLNRAVICSQRAVIMAGSEDSPVPRV